MALPPETPANEEASDQRERERENHQKRSVGKVDDINIWLEHELAGAINGLGCFQR